ncbi:MAG TPA: hypothetical protein VFG24_05440, partial [Nitrosopumilaceae archaeon]|nr:hypothetical protein [Nitrosopumilaceae archaeon]
SGFKIFYSPVISNPKLMIITLNPGGGKAKDFKENRSDFENGDFSLPQKNEYTMEKKPPWKISPKLQGFFGVEHMDLLASSVSFPILFFRSKNIKQWRRKFSNLYSEEKREKAEEFCYAKSKKIIERINPSVLLIIGIDTYDKMKEHERSIIPLHGEEEFCGEYGKGKSKRKERVWVKSYWNKKPVLCVRHLSGAFTKKGDSIEMRKKFFEIINE